MRSVGAICALGACAQAACVSAVLMGGETAQDAPPASAAEQGVALYSRKCARCHGDRGQGSGTIPALADLGHRSDEQLEQIIRDGVPGSMMSGWKNRLTAGEIAAIVAYLRHDLGVEG